MAAPALGKPGPRPGSAEAAPARAAPAPRRRRRRFPSLWLRILAPNVLALAILVGGILYLDQYRAGLLDNKIAALTIQAELIAGALGESAVGGGERGKLEIEQVNPLIRRLALPTRSRARLFAVDGELLADSRALLSAGRLVQLRTLPPPDSGFFGLAWLDALFEELLPRLPSRDAFPLYLERLNQRAADYDEVGVALLGRNDSRVRRNEDGRLVVSVAVPVQYLRRVFGALLLSADSDDIEAAVRDVRLAILQVSAGALAITVLLSLFLAGTIARPLRRLAQAAERVRRRVGQRVEIPDFSRRRDEIGDLSVALREMTDALYTRLDAIDRFAADVSHEIRNPLTSLRSAVESVAKAQSDEQRQRLFAIIQQDVGRLDRLISDIANASRVDADMMRAEVEPLDLSELLSTVADIVRQRQPDGGVAVIVDLPDAPVVVDGIGGRLAQVVENLLANAVSFSPAGGTVRVRLRAAGDEAMIAVEDDGPGIPAGEEEGIFTRFYSQREGHGAFGQHSGLGLSIARQIVEAHDGTIDAANRAEGGAVFSVRLPRGRDR
ncbi:MAG: stimulus-sensing domain-containing protein [Alphaproteobacteria bacterium]